MGTLTDLAMKRGTDKHSKHDYTRIYEGYLDPIRHDPITFLEIGIGNCASLRMWSDYFTHPEATLLALDIKPKDVSDTKFKAFVGNQADPGILGELAKFKYDVVMDDGGHRPTQQRLSHEALWPCVKKSGLYIIEDINQANNEDMLRKWSEPAPINDYLFKIARKIIDAPNRKDKRHPERAQKYVDEIHFYRHLCIIRKAK